jgi:aminoglycoside phosphotransferase (APT) family kinase protein
MGHFLARPASGQASRIAAGPATEQGGETVAGGPPGELIGAGRTADVYAVGQDRVLRRCRVAHDVQVEAEIMAQVAESGFPVPRVYDADGADLVMERLDGRDMLADLSSRPSRVRAHARTLAGLHDRLHQLRAPAGLPAAGRAGDRVLHLDLHPANVMLTSRGPVVIDWTSARAGAPGADVAMAYLIMVTSDTDLVPWPARALAGVIRSILVRDFLAAVHDDPQPHIAATARAADRAVRPAETDRLLRIAEQAEQRADAGTALP